MVPMTPLRERMTQDMQLQRKRLRKVGGLDRWAIFIQMPYQLIRIIK